MPKCVPWKEQQLSGAHEEIIVNIHKTPGSNISIGEPTRQQKQGTLYQKFPSFPRRSTKNFQP